MTIKNYIEHKLRQLGGSEVDPRKLEALYTLKDYVEEAILASVSKNHILLDKNYIKGLLETINNKSN